MDNLVRKSIWLLPRIILFQLISFGVTPAFSQSSLELQTLYQQAEALRDGGRYAEAATVYADLSEAGVVEAMSRLARLYATGNGVEQDLEQAAALFQSAINGGDTGSYVGLGRVLRELGDGSGAVRAYEAGMQLGSRVATFELGRGHLKGNFGAASDPSVGFEIIQSLAASGHMRARRELAAAYAAGRGTQVDVSRAITLYELLLEEGDARAGDWLGDLLSTGVQMAPDREAAISAYYKALALGRTGVLRDLVEVYVEEGRAIESVALFDDLDLSQNEELRVLWYDLHARRDFGPASDVEIGVNGLIAMSNAGNVTAARAIAGGLSDLIGRYRSGLASAVATLTAAVESGDRAATEDLAELYRKRPSLFRDAARLHSELLIEHGHNLSPANLFVEEVYSLFAKFRGEQLRGVVAAKLAEGSPEEYERGLFAIREAEVTVFTYILQNELRRLGYGPLPQSGLMNRATLNATLQYCADRGFYDVCIHGPLRTTSIKLIVEALTADRI